MRWLIVWLILVSVWGVFLTLFWIYTMEVFLKAETSLMTAV